MSNAPFKIAFWVMCLAFVLTVLMTGLKPEEIRTALNRKTAPVDDEYDRTENDFDRLEPLRSPSIALEGTTLQHEPLGSEPSISNPRVAAPATNSDDTAIAFRPQPGPQIVLNDAKPFPSVARPNTTITESSPETPSLPPTHEDKKPDPVQVAMAEPAIPIGLFPLAKESPPSEAQGSDPNSEQDQNIAEAEKGLNMPVPAPLVTSRPSESELPLQNEVAQLRTDLLRLQLADARHELNAVQRLKEQQKTIAIESEIAELKKKILAIKESEKLQIAQSSHEVFSASLKTDDSPAPASVDNETVAEGSISVTEGMSEGKYNFEFVDAQLSTVLTTMADYVGWQLIIDPEISGTFSGSFPNTDAEQAFAAVIRMHEFGISRRGNYVLVRRYKDAAVR